MGHIFQALRESETGAAPASEHTGLPRSHASSRVTPDGGSDTAAETARFSVSAVGANGRLVSKMVVSRPDHRLFIEQFRSLAAALYRARLEKPLRSILITSPSPGDGKSYTAANLALTLSESYRARVLLIDGDLRRPSLHVLLGASNRSGLSEALRSTTDEKVAALRISERLSLLPAGGPDASPLPGLSSNRMKRIIDDGSADSDWVIIDSPPIGVLVDGRLVSDAADAAILVIRAGVTTFADLMASAETIGRERILGLVLNAVDPAKVLRRSYYDHYYGADAGKR